MSTLPRNDELIIQDLHFEVVFLYPWHLDTQGIVVFPLFYVTGRYELRIGPQTSRVLRKPIVKEAIKLTPKIINGIECFRPKGHSVIGVHFDVSFHFLVDSGLFTISKLKIISVSSPSRGGVKNIFRIEIKVLNLATIGPPPFNLVLKFFFDRP
jgi:hypothetical protein